MNNSDLVNWDRTKPYNGKSIALIGPPLIGKTTAGKIVGRNEGIPFYDLDAMVAYRAGFSTPKEVAQSLGMPRFREMEYECLSDVIDKDDRYVVALGGGINCHSDNPDILAQSQELIGENFYNIVILPSENGEEAADILWKRQENSPRATVTNKESFRKRITSRMPLYYRNLDALIVTGDTFSQDKIQAIEECLGFR